MGRVYFVNCPKCNFNFIIDELLLAARVDAICPQCHFVFNPTPQVEEESQGPSRRG